MEFALVGRLLAACVVVAIVLYLLAGVARMAVRSAACATPGGRIVAVLETTALPNAASLHVIRVAERYYVLGRSAAQVTLLCEIPAENAARAQVAAAPGPPEGAGGSLAVVRRCISRLRRLGG